ncbi:MAG: hypothetical protein KC618_01315 [Candidatus Omnitrophica bacterium]|nr:hypothetical protein [Candidatus Omnitrophota bacterium]
MKKIFIIMQSKYHKHVLRQLQDLGAVHVEHDKVPSGHGVQKMQDERRKLEQVLAVLKPLKKEVEQKTLTEWHSHADGILRYVEEIEEIKDDMNKRQVAIAQWEKWGDFNPDDIRVLKQKGLFVKLCQIPVKQLNNVPKDIILKTVFTAGGQARCVAVMDEDKDLPFDEVTPPQTGLAEMQSIQLAEQDKIAELESVIENELCYLRAFETALAKCEDILAFEEASVGMKHDEDLSVLKGFIPAGQSEVLEKTAKAEGWGILIQDPDEDDEVPTLLKNSKVVNLSKPAMDMIEILPGYNEVDVSKVFIVFFTLFFGMLIGDAAYGLIFGGLTMFAHFKLKDKIKDKTAFHLLYLLTGFTVVWGVLTGTYFGQQWLPDSISPVIPWLNDPENLQWLCFTIALVHLSVARIWAFTRRLPSLTALAELGWLLIVWGMYFLANMFVLGREFPLFAKWFFIVGIALSFIFMFPFKEMAKKMPQQLIPFMLGIIGAGTDIISYVRLFAVGLATVAVADAANSMPGADLPGGLNYFLFVFLHILNMVLAAMAILVHAIRLNVLEFSGHIGLEWAGLRYNPFKKKLKQV